MAQLTAAQLSALKADIAVNTNTVLIGGVATQIKNVTAGSDNDLAVATWYNLTAAGPYVVWRDLSMDTVLGLITYANMTPADGVPTDTALNVAIWQARSLACQGKQFNLQNLTIGRTTAPMKKVNYRAGMQDCLTNLPAGASGGGPIAANWVGVRDAAKFNATNVEKLLASGAGTAATPSDLSFEGSIAGSDIAQSRDAA